jgi:peptide/nickel transport system permease protein
MSDPSAALSSRRLLRLSDGWRRLFSDPMGLIGLTLVVLLALSAIFAPWLAPFEPNAMDVMNKLLPPSGDHWLGTDQLGRDVFSRVLYGGRVALTVALTATGSALIVGASLGLAAGYGPRWLDNLFVLVFDTVRCFPTIIFALAVGPLFGGGLETVIVIIVITTIPYYGRIVRTQVLALKNSEFIIAERAMGASSLRIVFLHLLPNIIGPVLILASMDIPIVITAEAGLSFLGVGVKPPTPSWGLILDDGYSFIHHTSWLVIAGGIPLILATLGFTFLGEALRDAFDPKLRREGAP